MTSPDDEAPSEDTLMLVARVRHRAGEAPTVDQVTALAVEALSGSRGDLTAAEIRQLATQALHQAQQVSFLLGKLAGMVGRNDPAGGA